MFIIVVSIIYSCACYNIHTRWSEALHGVSRSPGVHFEGEVSSMLLYVTDLYLLVTCAAFVFIAALCHFISTSDPSWSYLQYVRTVQLTLHISTSFFVTVASLFHSFLICCHILISQESHLVNGKGDIHRGQSIRQLRSSRSHLLCSKYQHLQVTK